MHNLIPKSRKRLAGSQIETAPLQTIDEESEGTLVDVDKLEKDLELLQQKKANEQRVMVR